MRFLLFVAFFCNTTLFFNPSLQAQENCNTSSALWKDYKLFIPTEDSPVFTIKVNFIIPQRSDGSANFHADDEEAIQMFEKCFDGINRLWSKLKVPKDTDCYTGTDHLDDTHVRFVLNEVIFVQDDFYWDGENGSGCPNQRNWFLNPLDEEIRKNPAYAKAINIYLPNMGEAYQALVVDETSRESPKAHSPCSELPSHKILDRSSRINQAGTYNKFYWMKHMVPTDTVANSKGHPWDPTIFGWMVNTFYHTLAHELGHSMGLSHANEYHGRNKCDESIMNQLHGKPHNYLQPSEIGKIHRNLRMTNIRNFLLEDVHSSVPMILDEDTEFSMDFKSYEDIIVRSGKSFDVQCQLSLHEDTRIVVEPGATLIVGADINSRSSSSDNLIVEVQKERWRLFGNKNRKIGKIDLTPEGQLLGSTSIKKVKRRKT